MGIISCSLWLLGNAHAEVLAVGPGRPYAQPSVAAEFAQDGDVIEIDASGRYDGDVAVWRQNRLTIRGIGGRPHIHGTGAHAKGKGLWLIQGNDTVVENIEFSGARVPDKNGAGIRQEGSGLTVRRCYFHDNQNGILAGKNKQSSILIEHSEFARNGHGRGQTHNIYVGRIRRFEIRFSYIHHAKIGHNVKSRAMENHILYNRIMDEKNGTSSYAVDLPNGGLSFLIGNLIQQGPLTDNRSIISYGAEGLTHSDNQLWIVNNTITNDRSSAIFIKAKEGAQAHILNNLFIGKGILLKGRGQLSHNIGPDSSENVVARKTYDYQLIAGAPAIGAGLGAEALAHLGKGFDLAPKFEYVHLANSRPRRQVGQMDIGAYEYAPQGIATIYY